MRNSEKIMPPKKSLVVSVWPQISGGECPVKTEVGQNFEVTAFADPLAAEALLKVKPAGASSWQKIPMSLCSNGKWRGATVFEATGYYDYTVEATTKSGASAPYGRKLRVMVEQSLARFSAWYEIFPRSQGDIAGRSGTFRDVIKRLDYIKDLGFDVLYMAPIHPIGFTKRKGINNSLTAGPGDPGSCWAIGSEAGGHKSVHPDLGTIDDFRALVEVAAKKGLAVALDIGLQCSPDHPYVKEHPEWFYHEADGTIKCAENPPKKYEDVYPLNFYPAEGRKEMWDEMKSIFEFWAEQGVKLFRIDNPHTKPAEFWQWAIAEVKKKEPDAVFLSEAFTNYEKLEELAAVGFSQSYGYFTWRNGKNELIEYMLKLTQSHLKNFLRMNLFVNTPDILPTILQTGGRQAFMSRIALATTLSSCYGMYNGYELCENEAVNGKEDYWRSEKYEYKPRDWDAPGNIKDYIKLLNKIRRLNPALRQYDNLRFANSTNDHIIAYYKVSPDGKNRIFAAVNLDPHQSQDSRVTVPLEDFGISTDEDYIAEDLLSGRKYIWRDRENYVRLDPYKNPAAIFRITPTTTGGKSVGKKIKPAKNSAAAESEKTAREHAVIFFELRKKVLERNDPYARRELSGFYSEHIAPRTYAGETFDETYTEAINRSAKREGFRSIAHANAATPGH